MEEQAARGPGRARAAPPRRPALPRPVVRADRRGRRPRRARGALPRGARAPLRLPDGGRAGRARQRARGRHRAGRASPSCAEDEPTGDAEAGERRARTSTATGARSPVYRPRPAWARASRSRARRSSSSPRRPASCGPGWSGAIDDAGTLVLERDASDASIPSRCRVLASALSGIAEEMGAVLIRGAYSSNIKERRDCSAALFDAEGAMVAQAEHIPVHLGAMPEAVAAVIEREPEPGDVWIAQRPLPRRHAPARHHARLAARRRRRRSLGYAVTRAHHSDVGGMRPGSMPADSRDDLPGGARHPAAAARATTCSELILRQRAHARHPPRRPARADRRPTGSPRRRLERAGRAARPRRRRAGVRRRSLAYAERRTREALARACPTARYEAEREIEGDGVDRRGRADRASRSTVDGDALRIDFAGTDDQVAGNVNCPLVGHALGLLLRAARRCCPPTSRPTPAPTRRSTIEAPEGSLVNAQSPAAVVAGNVETSQRDRRHRAARRSRRRSTCPRRARGR